MTLPVPFIDVQIRFDADARQQNPLSLELREAQDYSLDEHGNLTLLVPIELGSYGRVRFFLQPDLQDLTLLGLKIARQESELPGAPILTNTGGSFHADTQFKVFSDILAGEIFLELSTWPTEEALDPLGPEGWFYTVGVQSAQAGIVWMDPRLHNKGEGQRS